MKLSNVLTCGALLVTSAMAFTVIPQPSRSVTALHMFGGGGAASATEDDPEAQAKMEQVAAQMGMSLEEYQLGIKARIKLSEDLSAMRIEMGDPSTVSVARDGKNPPEFLQITITEKGKALGKEVISKDLVTALKKGADASRVGRAEAQKNMMQFIGDEMKKLGKY
jgi:hypothetical protein